MKVKMTNTFYVDRTHSSFCFQLQIIEDAILKELFALFKLFIQMEKFVNIFVKSINI